MKFDPLKSSVKIVEDYRRYILTTFKTDNEKINNQLAQLVSSEAISNGPFLSIAPNYLRQCSLKSLIGSKVTEGFNKIKQSTLDPEKFILYKHQVDALDTVSVNNHNLVLSTGTGSGKTFSFLLPILNYLLSEREKGTLCDGVRAMIVYPMNALANDQMDVLRGVLKGTGITFGSFTGETEETEAKAQKKYLARLGKPPGPNEFISREVMNQRPPNVLITNYAMLEHLLILPSHKELFGQPGKNFWKYIVLDEAHMYSGAKGTEVATLLRRLKEILKRPQLRFLLTSATLGGGIEDNDKVVNFANELCGTFDSECPFVGEDIVRASIYEHPIPRISKEVDDQFIEEIAELIATGRNERAIIEDIEEYLDESYPGDGNYRERIYDQVVNDPRIYLLKDLLNQGARSVNELVDGLKLDADFFMSFIQVISLAEKNGYRLFDSKYHMFIRSIDGVFTTLTDDPHVFIHKCTEFKNESTGKKEQVFEISTCSNCGHVYLVGKADGTFTQRSVNEGVIKDSAFMVISPNEFDQDNYSEEEQENLFELCTECGKICKYLVGSPCSCNNSIYLYRAYEDTKVCKCQNCGRMENRRGMLRQLYLGHDSSTAVVSSSLYGQLRDNSDHRFLSFSDNRQNAAYFAPYLAETHENVILHAAMYQIILENESKLCRTGMSFDKFHNELDGIINEKRIYSEEYTDGSNSSSADAWIMLYIDAARYNSNKSFEYLGQVYYTYSHDPIKIEGLSEEESNELVDQISKIVRDKVNINRPNEIAGSSVWDKYYRMPPNSIVCKNEEKGQYDTVLVTATIKRYIEKVTGAKDAYKVGKKILKCFEPAPASENGYILDYHKLIVKRKDHVYQCSKCLRRTPFNVKNVCYLCGTETLEKINTSELDETDSYVYNYIHTPLRRMRVKEHTAQLDHDIAEQYQIKFKNKELDALSCSTTFEVGVDIGNLNTVLMRNVPPTPANYTQRAGRAGRSPDSSAYALTFCKNSPHDTNYFHNPLDMIQGKVPVPNINTENLRIIIRHIFASALSHYWKNVRGSAPTKVQEFMEDYPNLEKYLLSKPQDLKEYLNGMVPKCIQNHVADDPVTDLTIDLEHFGWVNELIDPKNGRLTICKLDYDADLKSIKDYEEQIHRKLESIRRMITMENTIEYLSRHNIIPKYGFPSEVIELKNKDLYNTDTKLRLQRDLSRAISEYAPDSEIIADGKVVTSKYLKKLPSKDWPKYYYLECPTCSSANIQLYTGQSKEEFLGSVSKCPMCSTPYSHKYAQEFIIPKYGFLYEAQDNWDLASRKPTRTYSGEVFYRGNKTASLKKYDIPGHEIYGMYGRDDELVLINKSPFKICNLCGFGTLNDKISSHSTHTGKPCGGTLVKRSLGHVFKTDVFMIDLADCNISNSDQAMSVLAALINSLAKLFSVDENEINGCISRHNGRFCFVLFDNTPGGAGYVKSIFADNNQNVLALVKNALSMSKDCTCGSEGNLDCACYGCLLNYRNQKYHDSIKRSYVIKALSKYEE